MNVEYQDGRQELFRNQTPEDVAAMTKRLVDPNGDVRYVEAWREDKDASGPYPNNRAGRRKWQAELRHKKK